MAVRDGRGDVKQTTTGFRVPVKVQSLTSAKSKFLSLNLMLFNSYIFLFISLTSAKSKFLSLNKTLRGKRVIYYMIRVYN